MADPYNTPQNRPAPEPGADGPTGVPQTPPATEPAPPAGYVPPSPAATPGLAAPQVHADADADSSDEGSQVKEAAQDVADEAKDAGRAIKDTAFEEASSVKDDTVREAKRLGEEAGSLLQSQASDQLDRAAGVVRTFSDDVGRMAKGEQPEPGVASDLAEQLSSRADAAATWLEQHEPADVLHEVQSFARRRPFAFLAISAGVGFAAGRLTRGIMGNHSEDSSGQSGRSASVPQHHAEPAATPATAATPVTPAAPTPPTERASAPVSGNPATGPGGGAPAYGTRPEDQTPGYSPVTDPYTQGGGR